MHERLRNVPSQLALPDVKLFGQQSGGTTGCPIPLKPRPRFGFPTLLVRREGHQKTAQHKGTLGVLQRPLIMTESVDIAFTTQLAGNRGKGGRAARIGGG